MWGDSKSKHTAILQRKLMVQKSDACIRSDADLRGEQENSISMVSLSSELQCSVPLENAKAMFTA